MKAPKKALPRPWPKTRDCDNSCSGKLTQVKGYGSTSQRSPPINTDCRDNWMRFVLILKRSVNSICNLLKHTCNDIAVCLAERREHMRPAGKSDKYECFACSRQKDANDKTPTILKIALPCTFCLAHDDLLHCYQAKCIISKSLFCWQKVHGYLLC